MPTPARLEHVQVKLRVSVDRGKWEAVFGTPPDGIEAAVRRYVVTLVNESPAANERAIASARRDGL